MRSMYQKAKKNAMPSPDEKEAIEIYELALEVFEDLIFIDYK